MNENGQIGTPLDSAKARMHRTLVGRLFWDRSFFHYIWTGGVFTVLNIFLVWLAIDIFNIPTLLATSTVVIGLFITRFVVYRLLKVM